MKRAEYITELKKKLGEEAAEITKTGNKEVLKELADIEEIVDCLIDALGASRAELLKAQAKIRAKAGSFKKRHLLQTVKLQDTSAWLKYYLAHPDKFKEIK